MSDRPANVDPKGTRAYVSVVCTDCDASGSQIMLSARGQHAMFDKPCACGGRPILLRDLQRQARLGRKIEALPS